MLQYKSISKLWTNIKSLWKRPEDKTFSVHSLDNDIIEYFEKNGNGCGAGKVMTKILPDFTFKYSCIRHDIGYMRGGALKDKLESDWVMLKYITIDTKNIFLYFLFKYPLFFVLIIPVFFIVYIIGLVYVLAVVMMGCFFFPFGRYKTIEEIKKLTY